MLVVKGRRLVTASHSIEKELDNHYLAKYNVNTSYKSPKYDTAHSIRRFMHENYVFEVIR